MSFFRWKILLVVLAAGGLAAPGYAKAPPEWSREFLAEDLRDLTVGQGAVQLLDSDNVRYETVDRVRRTCRGAIRVVTEQGRKRAACSYSYNADVERVRTARAWIVAPDGKNCEAVSAPEFSDTAAQSGWSQQRELGFSAMDRIALGGALVWEFEIESQTGIFDVNWSFSGDLAVGLSVLEVTPPAGGQLVWRATDKDVPTPAPGAAAGGLRWERRKIPAPSGDRPDGFLATPPGVSVRLAATGGMQTWEEFSRLAAGIIEPRAEITPEVRAKSAALTAGKSTRWERIRALTEFVQKDIVYLAITLDRDYLAGYRPHAAGEVLQNRHGDCKDKATLLVALLRAADENAQVVLVWAGNPAGVKADWPAAWFNHAIVAIAADDAVPAGWPTVSAGADARWVLFDPTNPTTPLGVLPASDQGGLGLVATTAGAVPVPLPASEAAHNRQESKVRATLDERGDLLVHIDEASVGLTAARYHAHRDAAPGERYKPLLEARLNENTPAVRDLKWTDRWDAASSAWQLNLDFKSEHFVRTNSTLMLVSPHVIQSRSRLTPWKTNQAGVVWMPGVSLHKEVRLKPPSNATVEEVPDEWSRELPTITCRLRYRKEAEEVVYELDLSQRAGFLEKVDYEALREFIQKLQEAERRPVVLRRTAAAKPAAAKPNP